MYENGPSRDELIQEYQCLVTRIAISVAKRLPSGSYEMEDLVGYGQLGLLDAVAGYDAEQGEFGTYAFLRIRGAIIDGLRTSGKFPRQLYEIRKRILEHTDELTSVLGRLPEPSEVAERAGMSGPEYRVWDHRIRQMEQSVGYDYPQEVLENIPDGNQSFITTDLRGDVASAMKKIPRRERVVIYATFWMGLGNEDIAAWLGVKPYRVAKLRKAGLEHLRKHLLEYGGW